jgi:hypothetical protein
LTSPQSGHIGFIQTVHVYVCTRHDFIAIGPSPRQALGLALDTAVQQSDIVILLKICSNENQPLTRCLNQSMFLSQRQVQIAEMIRQQDFIRVEVLAQYFNVTTQTIRRDLIRLCERGIARRLHGGVQRMNTSGNVAYAWRQTLNSEANQTLARHVPNGVSVAFSNGTTPEIVSKALLGHQQLRIFTNNLNIAMLAMLERSGAQLIVCKGDLSP